MRKSYSILAGLIVLYLLNGIIAIRNTGITFDEGSHLSYGIRILKGDPERSNPEKDNSKMPISVINSLPRAAEQLFSNGLEKNDNGVSDTMNGRYVTLFFSVLIILLVFRWSSRLYGTNAGLFSAFLYAACPNSLASAILVTTDTYAVFFLLATMYYLWKFTKSRSTKDFIIFSILLALSQLAKQSLFHLYVLVPVCLIVYALLMREKIRWLSLAKKILIAASISWVLINAGFLFYQLNRPLGDYHFMSSLFQKLQHWFPAQMPMPISSAFVEGLDQAKFYDQLGGGYPNSSFGNVTILGQSSTGGSFWYYYFVSLFYKTPVTYLILSGWAIWLLFRKRDLRSIIQNEFFLLAPVIYFLVLMSFFYKTQAGIRHLLFIYPLLFILSGIIIQYAKGIKEKGVLAVLGLFLILSVARYHNNYFAYTNEFVWNKTRAWRIVGASNLNFGQANPRVKEWLTKHPDVQLAPEQPAKGKFLLVVDRYMDIWNLGKYEWLRNIEPIGHVEYVYLLFEVK